LSQQGYLQYRLNNKYSIAAMAESLSKANCTYVKENLYIFNYTNQILRDIGKTLGIDFSKKYLRLGKIKKILGATKK
jgi:hypothetical protein